MRQTIRLRRDTFDAWEEENPLLQSGEVGVAIGFHETKMKIGDGFARWNDLPYVGAEPVKHHPLVITLLAFIIGQLLIIAWLLSGILEAVA